MGADGDGRPGADAAARAQESRRRYAQALEDVVRTLRLRVRVGPRYDLTKDRRVIIKLAEACRAGMELPEEAFDVLVRAAVHEPDPSYDRYFLEPALSAFGVRRVRTALFDYLRTGTDEERAGAARAWYWAAGPGRYPRVTAADPASARRKEEDDASHLDREWDELALREFVGNPDVGVRRCLVPGLTLSKSAYPPELHGLVDEAMAIARSHPDRWIRHRVEGMTTE
ncbi:hypothetical protein ACFV1L_18030 [Kitasatospora sp. NPDC059646]|uniref:hypothetical protein n=1 Tax=Kitasatospora sp. NPDC059646 TaxID=3346893 RepID=UPI0036D08272